MLGNKDIREHLHTCNRCFAHVCVAWVALFWVQPENGLEPVQEFVQNDLRIVASASFIKEGIVRQGYHA